MLDNKYNVEEIRTIEQFEMLKTEWNSIVENDPSYGICLTFEFMRLWWLLFEEPNKKMCILVIKKNDNIIGIAPFIKIYEKFFGMPITKIEFLCMAQYADSPASFTPSLDFLIKENHEEVIYNIFIHLVNKVKGWQFIRLNPIPANSITLNLLEKITTEYNYKFINKEVFVTFNIKLTESWENYFTKLSKNLKRYLKVNERKLQQLGTIEYKIVTSYEEILQMFPHILEIEKRSWKWNRGVSINSVVYKDFYKRFAEVGGKLGWVQLWLLRLNDKYIAYDYNILYKNSLVALKGSYDKDYLNYSPSQLLIAEEIKHCYKDGIHNINDLWGQSVAKERWKPTTEAFNEVFIFKNSLYSTILHFLFFSLSLYRIRRIINDLIKRLFRKLRIRLKSSEYTRVDQVVNYASIFSANKVLYKLRRIFHTPKIIEKSVSKISGVIEVVNIGKERQLLINGETHTIIMTKGNWNEVKREYWGIMSQSPYTLTKQPRVLVCGLGGGAIIHLLEKSYHPSSFTVIEHDPEIVKIAKKYFFLDTIKNLSIIIGDATETLQNLRSSRDKFDLIIDDIFYNGTRSDVEIQKEQILLFTSLLADDGMIIFNRAIDNDEDTKNIQNFKNILLDFSTNVKRKTVRQRWSNEVIYYKPNLLYSNNANKND